MDVASAETQHDIAATEGIADIPMDALEPWLITGSTMTAFNDFINDRLPADARNRRFARGINIRHHHAIRVVEGAAKPRAKRFRARITMGLKHGEHPLAASRSRSFQCSANFGRMMRVIVNKQKAFALIFNLEPASRVLEFP